MLPDGREKSSKKKKKEGLVEMELNYHTCKVAGLLGDPFLCVLSVPFSSSSSASDLIYMFTDTRTTKLNTCRKRDSNTWGWFIASKIGNLNYYTLTWISLTLLLMTPEFLSALMISFSDSSLVSSIFPAKTGGRKKAPTAQIHKTSEIRDWEIFMNWVLVVTSTYIYLVYRHMDGIWNNDQLVLVVVKFCKRMMRLSRTKLMKKKTKKKASREDEQTISLLHFHK